MAGLDPMQLVRTSIVVVLCSTTNAIWLLRLSLHLAWQHRCRFAISGMQDDRCGASNRSVDKIIFGRPSTSQIPCLPSPLHQPDSLSAVRVDFTPDKFLVRRPRPLYTRQIPCPLLQALSNRQIHCPSSTFYNRRLVEIKFQPKFGGNKISIKVWWTPVYEQTHLLALAVIKL